MHLVGGRGDACRGGVTVCTYVARAVVANTYQGSFASAVAVQTKRVADVVIVGSLAMYVSGDARGCDIDENAVVVMSAHIEGHFASAAAVDFCCGGGIHVIAAGVSAQ